MYRKKKDKKKKVIVIFISIIAVFLLLFASVSLTRKYTVLESVLKDIAMVLNKVIMYPFTALNTDKDKDLSKSYVIQKNVNNFHKTPWHKTIIMI